MEQLDPQVVNLAKAIRQTESGGNYNAKGKSGEYGAYQYTEPTWNKDAQAAGVNVPLSQANREQQNKVAYLTIKKLKDQGYNVGQIASIWNSGKPDAYLDSGYKGTNKYGAKYDVAAYAKSVATAYQALKNGSQVGIDTNNPSAVDPSQQGGFVNPNVQTTPTNQFVSPPEVAPTDLSATVAQPQPKEGLLSKIGHGALGLLNSIEAPFVGLAATPVQLLAKAFGQADPYANGLPGLAGSTVPVTDLNVEKKLGDLAQVGSYFVPGEGVLGAVGMGALQGGGSAMSAGKDLGTVAGGTALGAATGLAAGAATKLTGKAIGKVGDLLTGKTANEAVSGIKKAYSEALNLNAGERSFEARSGKDLAQVLMENGAALGRHENGTLDASKAIETLQAKLDPLNQEAQTILSKPQGVVRDISMTEIANDVEARIQKMKIPQYEKNKIIANARKMLSAEQATYGEAVTPQVADQIKQGFQNTAFKKALSTSDQLHGNAAYLLSDEFKTATEKSITGTDTNTSLKALNKQRSDLIDAIVRLTKLDNNRLVRGGRLGNMLGGITGSIIGASSGHPLGALAGDYFGTKTAEFLNNPANRVAIAKGKAQVAGFLPKLLGKAAEPVGNVFNKTGTGVQKMTRPAALMSNLLTNIK